MPRFRGAIFDVDGVLVDSPHEKAWRESLRELMESAWSDIRDRTTWSPDAFTSRVYEEQMSGKPRMSGAPTSLPPAVSARTGTASDCTTVLIGALLLSSRRHTRRDRI